MTADDMAYEHVKEFHKAVKDIYDKMVAEIQAKEVDVLSSDYYMSVFQIIKRDYIFTRTDCE